MVDKLISSWHHWTSRPDLLWQQIGDSAFNKIVSWDCKMQLRISGSCTQANIWSIMLAFCMPMAIHKQFADGSWLLRFWCRSVDASAQGLNGEIAGERRICFLLVTWSLLNSPNFFSLEATKQDLGKSYVIMSDRLFIQWLTWFHGQKQGHGSPISAREKEAQAPEICLQRCVLRSRQVTNAQLRWANLLKCSLGWKLQHSMRSDRWKVFRGRSRILVLEIWRFATGLGSISLFFQSETWSVGKL